MFSYIYVFVCVCKSNTSLLRNIIVTLVTFLLATCVNLEICTESNNNNKGSKILFYLCSSDCNRLYNLNTKLVCMLAIVLLHFLLHFSS